MCLRILVHSWESCYCTPTIINWTPKLWVSWIIFSVITLLHSSYWGPVNITPYEFENGGLALKTHQIFSVHTTIGEFENATISSHFGIVFEANSVRKNTWLSRRSRFRKAPFSNVFRPHDSEKPTFSNSSCLEIRFRELLVWTEGLMVEIKPHFEISPAF